MPINKSRIKAKVSQAISNLPTSITLWRDVLISDGYDGGSTIPQEVSTFDGFLDASKSAINADSTNQSDSGMLKIVKKISLLTVYDDSYKIQVNDYFTVDGVKHRIVYPRNQYEIYWECECEVVK